MDNATVSADNLGGSHFSSPAAPTQPVATTPAPSGADNTPDKFEGKAKEDVIKSYHELEKRAFAAEASRKEYEKFINKVEHYFTVTDDGVIDFNRDLLRKMAEAESWGPSTGQADNPQNPTAQPQVTNNSEDDMTAFQDDPRTFLKNLVREEIMPALKDEIGSLQKVVYGDRHQNWVNELRSEFPDFEAMQPKVGEWLSKTGATVNTKEDLKNAYLATKAVNGGFVDANQHKQHVQQLMSTLQDINPSAGRPPIDENKASVAQLLGMERDTGDANTSKTISSLFGKQHLAPLQ